MDVDASTPPAPEAAFRVAPRIGMEQQLVLHRNHAQQPLTCAATLQSRRTGTTTRSCRRPWSGRGGYASPKTRVWVAAHVPSVGHE
jgi:hypothetical protein